MHGPDLRHPPRSPTGLKSPGGGFHFGGAIRLRGDVMVGRLRGVRRDQLAMKPVHGRIVLHWVFKLYGLPQDARTPRTLKGANVVVWRT